MNRQEHEQELAASNARDIAEDGDKKREDRLREFKEIDDGMKEIINYEDYNREPF